MFPPQGLKKYHADVNVCFFLGENSLISSQVLVGHNGWGELLTGIREADMIGYN